MQIYSEKIDERGVDRRQNALKIDFNFKRFSHQGDTSISKEANMKAQTVGWCFSSDVR